MGVVAEFRSLLEARIRHPTKRTRAKVLAKHDESILPQFTFFVN